MAFLPALGAIASAGGAILGGISAANAANYQAKVARNNSRIAQQNAVASAQASSSRVEQEGLKAAQRLASVETGLAANNIDVNTGSAAAVQESQHALGMLDTATVANEGALKVYGYEQERSTYNAQAAADKAQVVPDIIGGVLKAAGSIGSNAGALGLGGGAGEAAGAAVDTSSLASGSSTIPSNYEWMRSSADYNPDHDFEFGY